MEEGLNKWIIIAVIALVVGAGGGYYYGQAQGHTAGVEKGRADLLAEQEKAVEDAKIAAQEQIAESANPFEAAQTNPFEGGYENPFKNGGAINPFAE